MEKIYIKPTSREILIKPEAQKEGHLDVFSYDFDANDSRRKLGNLYIIGNIQTASEGENSESAYAVNLVASLAKREYYSQPELTSKEAFVSALKKVNDVVEEFFKNKDTKINIGVFAIASEQIHISKLGKFKIVMARDNKNIDIFNNISLFNQTETQEKEFSNIVSGKVSDGDKILAYYPSRAMVSREKTIKESLLKSSPEEFADKLQKKPFACAALYIDIKKTKEEMPNRPRPEIALALSRGDGEPRKQVEFEPREDELIPKIIPSEFSLGKKQNQLLKAFVRFKVRDFNGRNWLLVLAVAAVVVITSTLLIKSVFFTSAQDKKYGAIIKSAQADLSLAKTKITSNDIPGARVLLVNAFSALLAQTELKTKNTETLKAELAAALDQIDRAQDASLTITEALPKDADKRITDLESARTKASAGGYGLSGTINLTIYEGNVYAVTADKIYKVADAFSKKNASAKIWLAASESLAAEPALISVDGRVYVLNKSGTLTTYYKGKKAGEVQTLIAPDSQTLLLTTADGNSLYLINKFMGRIYIIKKDSGALEKTLKLGASPSADGSIKNATIDDSGNIYIISADNKIWKAAP